MEAKISAYYWFSVSSEFVFNGRALPKLNRSSAGKLRDIILRLEGGEGETIPNPKQRCAFISSLISLLGNSFVNPPMMFGGVTHTHMQRPDFHLIRFTYILLPHGQMIREARFRVLLSCCEGGGSWRGVLSTVHVCVCEHKEEALIQGEE